MRETPEKFAVRETALVLGCSPYVIYSKFKGQICGGLTEEQLDEVLAHLSKKGIRPYKYKTAELEKVKLYLDARPGAQQHIKEVKN